MPLRNEKAIALSSRESEGSFVLGGSPLRSEVARGGAGAEQGSQDRSEVARNSKQHALEFQSVA